MPSHLAEVLPLSQARDMVLFSPERSEGLGWDSGHSRALRPEIGPGPPRGSGSGKLAARERDEGEDKEGEARPPAFWSRLPEPELEGRRRSRSWREDARESGTAMRLCSGSAPAAGGAASPLVSHSTEARGGSRSWGPAWSALFLSSRTGMLQLGTAGPARSRPHHPKRRAAN